MDPTDGIGQFLLIDLTGDVHVVGPALRRHLAGHNGRWELVPINRHGRAGWADIDKASTVQRPERFVGAGPYAAIQGRSAHSNT